MIDDKTLVSGWIGDEDNTLSGSQAFKFTDHGMVIIDGTNTVDSADIYVSFHAGLAEHVGIIAPGTAHTTNIEGRNIRPIGRKRAIPTGRLQTFTTYLGPPNIDFVELCNQVNWEIIGLDNGWFKQVFNAKDRVVHVLSNVCDSLVIGDTRTNVLAEAKVEALQNDGQEYYEPTHLCYVPVRKKELHVIEIKLDDISGHIVNLGGASHPWCSISSGL